MRGILAAGTALLLLASAGFSQCYIEADLNGVVGDPQPDYIVTALGESIPVDIWFLGESSCACTVIGMYLCDGQHALEYLNTQYYPLSTWSFATPGPPDSSGCIVLQGTTASWIPMAPPWRVATVSYQAAVDGTIAELTLGAGSGVLTIGYETVYFANNGEVLARIQIGDVTEAEETSWGSIKALFR